MPNQIDLNALGEGSKYALNIESETLEDAYANVRDALAAVIELYEEQGRPLPQATTVPDGQVVWSDGLVEVA